MRFISQRRLDQLGRVVIPSEIRSACGWKEETLLDVLLDKSGRVILRTAEPYCCVCGAAQDLKSVKTKWICPDCAAEAARWRIFADK